jgi:predicted Ser/Thr protein kinase
VSTPLRPNDPRQIGAYQLLGRLGAGGMGVVYLGRAQNGRLVAVKVIQAALADEYGFRARFRSEVNRARQVPPFCTAEVLDADVDNDPPYLVVEYVDGPNLLEMVRDNGPLGPGALQGLAVGVATALAAIHSAGVIHRDLKPQNVLFALGSPKVIDFGIARAYEATSAHTRPGEMVGTVAYMAPERLDAQGREASYPADIFSWAVVVAYAATGTTPFDAGSPTGTAVRILTQPPDLNGVPPTLREVLARALSKEPQDRPTARDLVDWLVDNGPTPALPRPVAAAAAAATTPIRPRRRKRPWILAAVGALVLLVLGCCGLLHIVNSGSDEQDAETRAGDAVKAAAGPKTLIQDPLTKAKLWKTYQGKNYSCRYDAELKMFTVGSDDPVNVRCPGPATKIPADMTLSVDVTLLTPSSCATVYWLDAGSENYELVLCATRWDASSNTGTESDSAVPLGSKKFTKAITPGTPSRLVIKVKDYAADLTLNGATMGRVIMADQSRASGKLSLGMFATGDGDPYGGFGVGYANIKVQSS